MASALLSRSISIGNSWVLAREKAVSRHSFGEGESDAKNHSDNPRATPGFRLDAGAGDDGRAYGDSDFGREAPARGYRDGGLTIAPGHDNHRDWSQRGL